VAQFRLAGNTYKWIGKEERKGEIDLELSSSDVTHVNPIARYSNSRRDLRNGSEPRTIDATLEISADGSRLLDICIFSFVVTEKLRRNGTPREKSKPAQPNLYYGF